MINLFSQIINNPSRSRAMMAKKERVWDRIVPHFNAGRPPGMAPLEKRQLEAFVKRELRKARQE